ncbi:MAG: type VI secretion system protein TssL, long form [Candidatus Competibacterales bacterium]
MEMAAVAPSPARPTMPVDFLRREIDQGLVEVDIVEERLIVRFQGDGLFASGSAQVKEAIVPVLQRVVRSLEDYPGGILGTGLTDNIPIRTLRFPSNWHLSQARAEAVRAILTGVMVDPERVIAEGKSDAEPLVANDTPANRALNRRVDISLLSPVPPG